MENKVPGVQTCSGNRRVGRKLGPGTAVDYQIDAKKNLVENIVSKKSYVEKTFSRCFQKIFWENSSKDFHLKYFPKIRTSLLENFHLLRISLLEFSQNIF